MIFVTLGGVVEFDFSRILKLIDELVLEKIIDSQEILAQIGHSKYEPMNFSWFRFVETEKFHSYMETADVVICHGGAGTLINAVKLEKKIIVFPRLKMYNEHLDDHQTELAKKLERQGYVLYAEDKESLKNALQNVGNFIPNKWCENNTKLSHIVMDFLNEQILNT